MIDELSIVETDKVIHTVETDMVNLVIKIECFGMSFDEFDKETGSSDGMQPKQADLSDAGKFSLLSHAQSASRRPFLTPLTLPQATLAIPQSPIGLFDCVAIMIRAQIEIGMNTKA
ncbi:hypothetical protein Tco_0090025 [Tanacetum coccineum]